MSELKRIGQPRPNPIESGDDAVGRTSARVARPFVREPQVDASSYPSAAGTAVLNLSDGQTSQIRKLLVALRKKSDLASDVRKQIFSLLSGEQRRALGAAYFIISVRV